MSNIYDNPEYWCGDIGYRPPGYGDFTINAVKEICILLYRPKSVLDIGCAYGFTVARLNALGIYAVGLDCSALALSRCPVRTNLVQGVAWELPFKDKEFDFAFSSGVLEHIPKDKLQLAVSEIQRVCRRGLIGVSCRDDPTTHDDDDKTHETILSQKDWQSLFSNDFTIVSDSEPYWQNFALLNLSQCIKDAK